MAGDPRDTLASSPMRPLQIAIVAVCIALNGLDGFDVLAISFASPGIATEWGIDKAQLGIVLSMELLGMAAGSIVIGNVADRIGRRGTILACLAIMMTGMFAATATHSPVELSAARLFTGLGIGGMLSSTSALVSEFSNQRRHNLNVSLNIAGYSMGAIVGGVVVTRLLAGGSDWRAIFEFGAIVTAVLLPVAFFTIQESVDYLVTRRPANALEAVNRVLAKLRHPAISELPPALPKAQESTIAALFSSSYGLTTALLSVCYFTEIMLFYFILKWVPKIVVDMGFTATEGARVLVFANIGNLAGAILIGFAAQRFQPRGLIIGSLVTAFATVVVFGLGIRDLSIMSVIVAVACFFINASVVGLYPIMANAYPARLRATGTGFVIGIGRGGSALGPIVVGYLFKNGASLMTVSLAMGAGALVAAVMLIVLPNRNRAQAS